MRTISAAPVADVSDGADVVAPVAATVAEVPDVEAEFTDPMDEIHAVRYDRHRRRLANVRNPFLQEARECLRANNYCDTLRDIVN